MTLAPVVAAPWWLVGVVVLAAVPLGHLLGRELETGSYRLDDEHGPLPRGMVLTLALPVLWGALAWRLGGPAGGAGFPAYLLLAWAGTALVWVDVDVHRLPEGLTLPTIPGLLVLLAVASATTGEWGPLLRAVVCGAVAWLVYLALALLSPGGLGLGDATLGGLVAVPLGYLGWWVPVVGFVAGYLLAGVVVVVGLAVRRLHLRSAIAFGPFILGGTLVALFVRFQDVVG